MSCRLLYLVGQLRSGGLERQLYLLLMGMDRKRYKPEVIVWNYRKDAQYLPKIGELGVPVHSLPTMPFGVLKLRALRRLVLRIKPEVLHSYSFYTNFAAWWATLGSEILAIGSVRSEFNRAKKNTGMILGRLCARWPRSQIFNSFSAAETTKHAKSFFVPKNVFVVRNSVDFQLFKDLPFYPSTRVRIVGIGSLFQVKRWDRLIVASLALKQKGFHFFVQIIGDGPLRETLSNQVDSLGLTDCVEFLGHRDNIPGLLKDAMFLVHTSDSEGCPNVVMEAMACGRAVVATDGGDLPNLVEDGQTGFVVPIGDDARLVGRMACLLSDPELCCSMGERGRVKAEREFGLNQLVAKTLDVYRAVSWKESYPYSRSQMDCKQ